MGPVKGSGYRILGSHCFQQLLRKTQRCGFDDRILWCILDRSSCVLFRPFNIPPRMHPGKGEKDLPLQLSGKQLTCHLPGRPQKQDNLLKSRINRRLKGPVRAGLWFFQVSVFFAGCHDERTRPAEDPGGWEAGKISFSGAQSNPLTNLKTKNYLIRCGNPKDRLHYRHGRGACRADIRLIVPSTSPSRNRPALQHRSG